MWNQVISQYSLTPRSLVFGFTVMYMLAFFAPGNTDNIFSAQVARVTGITHLFSNPVVYIN